MNLERLEKLAATIEKAPHVDETYRGRARGFNMDTWRCKSVACIGGWTEWLWPKAGRGWGIERVAGLLDIDRPQARELCYPGDQIEVRYCLITPAQAAKVLRNLIQTGQVDWQIIEEERAGE